MRARALPVLFVLSLLMACHGRSAQKEMSPATSGSRNEGDRLDAPVSTDLRAAGAIAGEAELKDQGTSGSWYARESSDATGLGTMIIRTGQASIQVDSLGRALGSLRMLAGRLGGYLANTSYQGGNQQYASASIEIKVPSDRFDDLLSGISPLGKLEYANVTSQDVGEEYADIDARVTNSRHLEARLIDLLANRPGKLQEILELERELARVREEIERYEGRMRYLKSHASLSSLTISVHEPVVLQAGSETARVLSQALNRAWSNFVELNARAIASLGVLLPVVLALAAGIAVVRRWWRGRKPVLA